MSVSIKEVIESAGYSFDSYEDLVWLCSQKDEFLELVEEASNEIEEYDDFCSETTFDFKSWKEIHWYKNERN